MYRAPFTGIDAFGELCKTIRHLISVDVIWQNSMKKEI